MNSVASDTSGSDRAGRFARIGGYGLLTAAIATMLGLRHGGLLQGELINPDSFMRLDRMRDMQALGAPVEAVIRDGSGHGTVLAWSHLLDSLLLLLALPFRLFMAPDQAVYDAAFLAGPLSMAALGAALVWAVSPFASRSWLWTAALLPALCPSVVAYGLPGVVHHHVLLAAVVTMCGGWAARIARVPTWAPARPGAGLSLGAWAAFGLWLSPETMPFVTMAFGAVWLAWLVNPPRSAGGSRPALEAGFGLLVLCALALAADPPGAGMAAVFIDRLSVAHVALAAAFAAIGAAACVLDRVALTPVRRAILSGAIASACLGAWLAAFPVVLRGADGVLDPATARAMFGHIREMLPVRGGTEAMATLLNGGLATGFAAWAAWTRRSWLAAYLALCGLAMVAFATGHVRFATYDAVLAAALLPVALDQLATIPALRAIVIATVFLSAQGEVLAAAVVPGSLAAQPGMLPACDVPTVAPLLAPYAGEVVLSDVNVVPELLYRTNVLTVGSLYHRNAAGFLRLRAAWDSAPAAVEPPAVLATGARLLLICGRTPWRLPAGKAAATLEEQMLSGPAPPWLSPLAAAAGSGWRLYLVSGAGRETADLSR